ncbi:hypothetical protein [Streptosporangium subroseum]|uniref:hypothetical protein n=1 Tax=Streptosporangium subroseum TaxID=106412 RepID=UPI003087F176|nr:hypothetical protein OHB15_23665 [Streptosporangium subroseum]
MTIAEAHRVPAAEWLRRLREVYADDVPGGELLRHTDADRLVILGSMRTLGPEQRHRIAWDAPVVAAGARRFGIRA